MAVAVEVEPVPGYFVFRLVCELFLKSVQRTVFNCEYLFAAEAHKIVPVLFVLYSKKVLFSPIIPSFDTRFSAIVSSTR